MERMSLFIISIIIASISVVGISVYYSGISAGYASNSTNITAYNQMSSINNITENLNDRIITQPTSTGGFAVLGDFLSYAYNTLQLTFSSYNLFYVMLGYGFSAIPTDSGSVGAVNLIKAGIGSIVLIIIVFVVITFWAGRSDL